jgi:drug/metabolite transporter (DMT)-like permease
VILVLFTLAAFAANNLLCRKALAQTSIDPASFTLIRMASGAVMLLLLTKLKRGGVAGTWRAALALLMYMVCFSFAYVTLTAGAGALLLFGAIQATMICWGITSGERLGVVQWFGLGLTLAGLVALVAPGVTAPQPAGALLMVGAGIAWGIYSLLGRTSKSGALAATAGNFLRATPLTLLPAIGMALTRHTGWDARGFIYAVLAGALASGVGYALWYAALPALSAATAASVQLTVPVITALGGAVMLRERITLRLTLASLAVLGGIALVIQITRTHTE